MFCAASAVNELNGGTSPLPPGSVWALSEPAAPLPSLLPLPSPSKPAPVAAWNSASSDASG
jgi:hypothetical protein